MPFWTDIYFINANSPIIEQIILFHDHSIIIISTILIFLFITLINLIKSKSLNLNLIENQTIETIWTILPIFLLIFIAIPRLRLLYLIEETFNPNLTIKITGHQWYWSYEFSEFKVKFDSFIKQPPYNLKTFRLLETDTSLILPINSNSRLLVTRFDVIHSWTIQRLGVKTDAIPGRLNQINLIPTRSGIFFGQCSEICGANHRFIPITLKIIKIKKFIKSLYLNNN